jgi:hypothetical protein
MYMGDSKQQQRETANKGKERQQTRAKRDSKQGQRETANKGKERPQTVT